MKSNSSKNWLADGQTDSDNDLLPITLKVWVDKSRFQSQNDAILQTVRIVEKIGQIAEINLGPVKGFVARNECAVCGWIHDASFTEIKIQPYEVMFFGGILPDIIALVHRALERGLLALSTKDAGLLKACGGYRHPCKAFDDLKRRDHYKILFDTRRRGFISLRRGRDHRNKSESGSE
jgi:hypothetical protein